MKQLTICIPTYNRSKFIKNQLLFFYGEIQKNPNLKNLVSFIVSDNASTDDTSIILKKLHIQNDFFEHHTNKENLGLVGNILALLNLSSSEYIWFVSDDDELNEGIIAEILNIIANHDSLDFLFLNYSFNEKKVFLGKSGYRSDSKEAALEVFRGAYGSLVFMTSCVYKRKNILKLSYNTMFKKLSAPLLFSFYSCSKGSIYITSCVWVKFRPGNASYAGFKRIMKLKFEEYIAILEYLPKLGYMNSEVKKTIQIFFEKQSHAHLLYNFINFFNSLRLYKYYSFKTVIKFPENIVNYIKK